MHRYVRNTSDGGLGYEFIMLNRDLNYSVPTERVVKVHAATARSLIITFALETYRKHKAKKTLKRVLIVMNGPYI